MIVLVLDTAAADCTAALYDSTADRLLACALETIGKGHAERLMAVIDAALDEAGLALQAVEKIAVTVGPGSFTGIRVGVAAARGLALALGIEAVGVSTLAVVALQARDAHPDEAVMVAMDARRGEVYTQMFTAGGEAAGAARLVSYDEGRALARECGALVAGSGRAIVLDEAEETVPDRYGALAIARLAMGGAALPPKPLYLRSPDAKPSVGFAVTHA